MLLLLVLFNLMLLLLYLFLKPQPRAKANLLNKTSFPYLSPLAYAIVCVVLKPLKRQEWFNIFFMRLERQLRAVYGQGEDILSHWLTYLVAITILLIDVGLFFAFNADDPLFLLFGLCIVVLYSSLYFKQLENQRRKRDRQILRELTEWLSKLVLLVQAGETIQQAFIRSINGHEQNEHPLYSELKISVQQLKNKVTFSEVLEQLSQRCQLQEMSGLATTILIYHQRGGTDFSLVLRGVATELWEKRKALVKQQGEEAASKLVIPLVIIFIGILLIIAWPALQMLAY